MQLKSAIFSGISFHCTTADLAQLDELHSRLYVYDTIIDAISDLDQFVDDQGNKLEDVRESTCYACGWIKEHNILMLDSCSLLLT